MSTEDWVLLGILLSLYGAIGVALWRNPELRSELRSALGPRALEARLHRWLITRHAPIDLGSPGEPILWCTTCRKEWPCAEVERLAEQKAQVKR